MSAVDLLMSLTNARYGCYRGHDAAIDLLVSILRHFSSSSSKSPVVVVLKLVADQQTRLNREEAARSSHASTRGHVSLGRRDVTTRIVMHSSRTLLLTWNGSWRFPLPHVSFVVLVNAKRGSHDTTGDNRSLIRQRWQTVTLLEEDIPYKAAESKGSPMQLYYGS